MISTNLKSILTEINGVKKLSEKRYHQLVKKYPKDKKGIFTKAEIIAAWRKTYPDKDLPVQVKPVRTISGVVPVTLLTKPYPCPGQCIFCPNDPKMPKSYLSSEPGAQRAAANQFDPYNQVITRLVTYHANGHSTDKAELIVLGGTWSSYPKGYKIWFIKRCFDALNDFAAGKTKKNKKPQISGEASWEELKKSQNKNERAASRCVGLSLETRPDFLNEAELIRFRRLGCTKVQIGIQSLNNKVLDLNKRGHHVDATKKAISLLRRAGFKIQAHWMANLYGSTPDEDIKDFAKLFSQPAYRPDELKIYPTALLETAELMDYFKKGLWKPYSQKELLKVLVAILPMVPQYCRVTRMIRDFSSDDIVAGNKLTNFRENVEAEIAKKGQIIREIRSREIKKQTVNANELSLKVVSFSAGSSQEKFIQFVTDDNRIAGFLRLSLPKETAFLGELKDSALVRELHVYGQALNLGEPAGVKPQHSGLGKKLLLKAQQLAENAGFKKLSVISAIGTKKYYQKQGFKDGELYQHLAL